jgi:hypothetical protein
MRKDAGKFISKVPIGQCKAGNLDHWGKSFMKIKGRQTLQRSITLPTLAAGSPSPPICPVLSYTDSTVGFPMCSQVSTASRPVMAG